jgi:hypothetical protein
MAVAAAKVLGGRDQVEENPLPVSLWPQQMLDREREVLA